LAALEGIDSHWDSILQRLFPAAGSKDEWYQEMRMGGWLPGAALACMSGPSVYPRQDLAAHNARDANEFRHSTLFGFAGKHLTLLRYFAFFAAKAAPTGRITL